jgi:hypothetical protein
MSEVKEAVVREPMIHINWPENQQAMGDAELHGRHGPLLARVSGTVWVGCLHLPVFGEPAVGVAPWQSSVHVVSLVGMELPGIWLFSLLRQQRRAREWSPQLTVFVLLMISLTAFVCTKPVRA